MLFLLFCIVGVAALLGVISEINNRFSTALPAYGGTLREGIIGNPRFVNPLLAQTDADRDLVSLTYAGILRHDANNNLIPALAENYQISSDGLQYTVTLKNNLRWSDGEKLTADDVVYTIRLINNPLLQSQLRAGWDKIEVEKIDDRTLRFLLPKAYVPFLENLTVGILPQHIWSKIPLSQFPLVDTNTNPVGAGPYRVSGIARDSKGSIVGISLEDNPYFVLGRPHIKNVELRFYQSEGAIIQDLQNGLLDSSGALSPQRLSELSASNLQVRAIGLQRVIAVFFNQTSNKFLGSLKIRQALNAAIDKRAIVQKVLNNYGSPLAGPLPPSVLPSDTDPNAAYNPELARKIIQQSKEKIVIGITTASSTPEFTDTAELLKEMWQSVGAEVSVHAFAREDLEQLVIGPRRYNAFLYGEEMIGKNPDPFAFWHSSQRAYPRLNIALYANSSVDKLLEQVRTEQDPKKRAVEYQTIQSEIQKDLPAIFLYSPSYLYVVPKDLEGIAITNINSGSDRFDTIYQWYLAKHYTWKLFLK